MTTGVDCKTCKLIVIDKVVNSPIIFKQMIGRGTRLFTDYGKKYFTIMDFRNATRQFADPDFDGDPIIIIDDGKSGSKKTHKPKDTTVKPPVEHRHKYYVNGVEVNIINEKVQLIGNDGRLITENLTDYSRRNIINKYATMNNFISMGVSSRKYFR